MNINMIVFILFVCSAIIFSEVSGQIKNNSDNQIEQKVNDLLSKMTLEEKIDMIGGYETFYIRPNERLGIPGIKMSDGPLGVRNYGKATAFPAGIAFAAAWNTDLTEKYGKTVGDEARARGVHIMLAPGVNIYRAPMCGRNFEYYGEDPFLSGKMASAYIRGVQSRGVMATVKHFAANNQEWDRHNVSSDLDERTLREIYLPAFRMAVEEGKVAALMTSYNLINGVHASENEHLIKDILKGEWKFDGIVMSDWTSTYNGIAAANAGLDLEMPSGANMNRETLLPAIKEGKIKESTIDDKIRRMLRVMFRFSFFDTPQVDKQIPFYNPFSSQIALQAAREGMVLLKNRDNILPLDKNKIKSIAVIGPVAHPAVTGGGGSSQVKPFRSVSFLDGLINMIGNDIKIYYNPGIETDLEDIFSSSNFFTSSNEGEEINGLKGEYYKNKNLEGVPVLTRIDRRINFQWRNSSPHIDIPIDNFSVRWSGKIKIEKSGNYKFYIRSDDGFRLKINNQIVLEYWKDQSATMRFITLPFEANNVLDIVLEYFESGGEAEVYFGYELLPDPKDSEALKLAAKTDVVILCVGFNSDTEGEGFDRPFELPQEQEDLIRNITEINKNIILVLTAGGNVLMMNWIDKVAALLHTWYPGQEGGTALAEIIFGKVNPSGKLPATFEKFWKDNPAFNSYYDDDKDNKVKYSEGIFIGYRYYDKNEVEPLFPFGFGLSYTTFEYSDLRINPEIVKENEKIIITFNIKNTGKVEGQEIAQVYISDPECSIIRPVKELKGFIKTSLLPGESKEMKIEIDKNSLSFFDVKKNKWVVEKGEFEVLVGSSSKDIRLKKNFKLKN